MNGYSFFALFLVFVIASARISRKLLILDFFLFFHVFLLTPSHTADLLGILEKLAKVYDRTGFCPLRECVSSLTVPGTNQIAAICQLLQKELAVVGFMVGLRSGMSCLAFVLGLLPRAYFADYIKTTDHYDGTVVSSVYYLRGVMQASFSYEVATTPCRDVIDLDHATTCEYNGNVQSEFPDDSTLFPFTHQIHRIRIFH